MNKKNCLLILVIFMIIVIFIDLIFNFSKIFNENFQNAMLEKSIISKKDGRIINIHFLKNDPNKNDKNQNRLIFLQSPYSANKNISINNDGTLSESFSRETDINQRWELIYINNKNKFDNILKNSKKGNVTDNSQNNYPFYIIRPVSNKNRALQFDFGSISCTPIGNYNNQKWDISNEYYKGKSMILHSVDKNNLRKNPDKDGEELDPNKINLNLKLSNDFKKSLNIEDIDEQSENSKSCGTYIKNDAISSLCPSCEPELFE